VLKSRDGQRTNAERRRTPARGTSARRFREIKKRAETHTHAVEKAKALKLDIEVAKLAAELKRLIETPTS
jgi:hypothetical protein